MKIKEYRTKMEKINDDTRFDSFFGKMKKHTDFLDLVAMGDDILPFIMEDMCKGRSQYGETTECTSWVHINLLLEITKDNDIDFSNWKHGKFQDNVDFWCEWWEREQREKKLKRITKGT